MDEPEAPSKNEARTALVVIALAAVVLGTAVWLVPLWLGNDAPAHLFDAYVTAHYQDPAKAFSSYYLLNRPVTAHGFLEAYRLFDLLLPWQRAYRLTIVVMAELWAFAFLFATTAVDRRRWPIGLAGFALALGWPLDLGLFSFWIATAGALVVVGLALRFAERRWLPVALALALWLTAIAHVFPAMVAGATLVMLEAARRRGAARWRALAWVSAAGVPAAVVALLATSAREQHDELAKAWGTLTERLSGVLACSMSGPWWRVLPLAMLAAAAVALLIARRKTIASADAALGGAGVVLLSLSVATPLHLRWMFFSPRFASIGMAVLLLALPAERLGARTRLVLGALLSVWVIAACWWSTALHSRLAESVRPALAALSQLEPAPARRLTVTMPSPADVDTGVRYLEPTRQLGQLVALQLGGVSVYGLVGSPAIHALLLRPDVLAGLRVPPVEWLERFDPHPGAARRAQLARVLAASTQVDELVVVGSEEDVAQVVEAGYRARLRAAGVVLARFEGCRGSVVAEAVPGSQVALDVGWWPVREPVQGVEGPVDAGGNASFDVDQLSCGELWLKARSGHCANGDAEGFVRGRLGDGPLRCRIEADAP